MTADEQAQVAAYVRVLADRMGLKDWQFYVSDEVAESPMLASIACAYGRKCATIRLGQSWREQTQAEHRQTITHELVHAHLEPMRTVLLNLRTNLGSPLYETVRGIHDDALEYAVDAIADALAPHLPLPNEDIDNTEREVAA